MELLEGMVAHGVEERPFRLAHDGEEVPGVLWRPEGHRGPTPLVLLGHGGTQHKRSLNVLGLARRFVRHLGASAVAIDAPGHGDRVRDPERAAAARADLERRLADPDRSRAGARLMPEEDRERLHERGRAEWTAVLDALLSDGHAEAGRVGYWGLSMGTMIGLPFVAAEPRVACAVLGLAPLRGWPGDEERVHAAAALRVPVLLVLQWDDQLFERQWGLDLFDAIGSPDKALHAFPGGHVDTPLWERDAYDEFFRRHLLA